MQFNKVLLTPPHALRASDTKQSKQRADTSIDPTASTHLLLGKISETQEKPRNLQDLERHSKSLPQPFSKHHQDYNQITLCFF